MQSDGVPVLVSTSWLATRLRDPTVRIVDARWYLDGRRGIDGYRTAHIPGAVFADVDSDLAAPKGKGPGRHPLPPPVVFADFLARIGVGPSTQVVAYDDEGGSRAARLWWMLRYFGHGQGSVLDGGLQKWQAEGRPTETGITRIPRAQPMELVALPRFTVDKLRINEMLRRATTVLLDARAADRYTGANETIDARGGHIPSAYNAPYPENLRSPNGAFRTVDELRTLFARVGVEDGKHVIVYCGSGVTACHTLLALHVAGFRDAQLYEGSWSDWSADPSLPIKTGSLPLGLRRYRFLVVVNEGAAARFCRRRRRRAPRCRSAKAYRAARRRAR